MTNANKSFIQFEINQSEMMGISAQDLVKIMNSVSNATNESPVVIFAKENENREGTQLQSKLVKEHDHCYFKNLVKHDNTERKREKQLKKEEERRKKRMNRVMYYKHRIETEKKLANYYNSQTLEMKSAIRKLKKQNMEYENMQKQKLFLWDFD